MASIQEAIRRLIYKYVVEGADKVVQSQEAVAASTTKTDKAVLSLEKSFGSLERRYIETVRAQQDYQKVQERVNAAVAQNPALQERANAVLAAASQRYGQVTAAQKAFATATSGVNAQLVALSAGAGPVGTFLAALGPWGFAASVGLGAVSAGFDRLVAGAERIGDKSIELRKFSDVTGLGVTQIKALTQAGGRLGVDAEEISTSLEKFSVGLNEARKGTGSLFDQVRAINPQLAIELAQTTNAAQAWDILAKALQGATEASQRNALARAAFGKGGIETGLVAIESATKGGIDAMAKGINLTQDWVTETARLRAENVQLEKSIKNAMDSAYALPILQRQNEFLKFQKMITEEFLKMDKAPLAALAAAVGPLGNLAAGAVQLGNALTQPRTSGVSGDEKRQALLNAGAAATLDPAALESWHQLEDVMGVVNQKAGQLVSTLEQEKNARAFLANTERERLALLGAAATEQEKLNLKTLELKVALDQGKLSLEDYKRAVEGLSQAFNNQMVALQGQLNIAQQLTGIGQINAQYEAAIANAKQQGLIMSQQTAIADAQRAIALAQVNTAAQNRLRDLQNEMQLIKAVDDIARDRIRSEQTLNKLLQDGVDYYTAQAVAAQELANATEQRAQQEYEANKAAMEAAQNAQAMAEATANTAANTAQTARFVAQTADDVDRIIAANREIARTHAFLPSWIPTGALVQRPDGTYSQYGGTGGGYTSTSNRMGTATTMGNMDENLKAIYGLNNSTDPLVRATFGLNDSMENLTDATKANTAATQSMTDVLSPYYSSDPRRTHLGFRAFAGGGIMTQYGELPLKQYQGGGIATSPQVAVFGEGSTPEAYVPAPNGRIPVEIRTPANSNQRPVNVTINVMGNADAGTVAALKQTSFQKAQQLRRMTG